MLWFKKPGKVKVSAEILGRLILFFYGGGGAAGLETVTDIAKKTQLKRVEIVPHLKYLCRHDMLCKREIAGETTYTQEMDVRYQDSLQQFLHYVESHGYREIGYAFEKFFWHRDI